MSGPVAGAADRQGRALAWVASVLGLPVAEVAELAGGLTSTMLAVTTADGGRSVLRLMTEEPWCRHGAELTGRERQALRDLVATPVPAPRSIALDATGAQAGVAAHLMTHLPGTPARDVGDADLVAMADVLATIHGVRPAEPFRTYESWAWEAKRVVPPWTAYPDSWVRAFALLDGAPPSYVPTFLHRDFSHRNLVWSDGAISGVVDWVETSTGPAWLDAAHAATTLAVDVGIDQATRFTEAYAEVAPEPPSPYWFVLDAVGFLAPPGRAPLFGEHEQLARLDVWLHGLVEQARP